MAPRCITTDLRAGRLWEETTLPVPDAPDALHTVCLYPDCTDQTLDGFGGAFTESAAVCWQSLPDAARDALIEDCYGSTGLRYTLGRVPMASCDFSLGHYDGAVQGSTRRDFSRDDDHILPMVQAAARCAGRSPRLVLSPWSPPAWMKSNGDRNHGGTLRPDCAADYAALLADYAAHYRSAGLDVAMMTVQNEPEAVQTWDSCLFTARQEGEFAVRYLRPALDAAGLAQVRLLCWDHNKEALLRRAAGTLAVEGADAAVDGVAFHWYTGDHFEAVALAHRRWPDKTFYFTEGCVEYSRFDGASDLRKAEMYAHDILGNLNAGTAGSLDWNLLLDAQGGPNHVGNFCEAPLMLDGRGGYTRKGSYRYIGQFSRYLRPGAVRLAASRWCSAVEVTAFRNPDGSRAVVLLNRTDDALPVCLADNGETPLAALTLAPHTIATVIL